jgi:hypothetical protein
VRVTADDGSLPAGLRHSRRFHEERLAAVHEAAYAAYRPTKYAGRLAVIRAESEPHSRAGDPSLGWAELIDGPVHTAAAPGHRTNLLAKPRVEELARIVDDMLALTETRSGVT